MKLETVSMIGRIILTLALIFAVYTETGIWTAIAFFCIFLSIETSAFIRRIERDEDA